MKNKIRCKLGIHNWSNWVFCGDDPYKAMEEVKLGCQLIFGFVQMGTIAGRMKKDYEEDGAVSKYIYQAMIERTNQHKRVCENCGKVELKIKLST